MKIDKNDGDDTAPPWVSARVKRPRESTSLASGDANLKAKGETILVVDDNPEVRALVVRILRSLDYHVLDADSGGAALRTLDENPRVSVMLCDVVLPKGMGGPNLSLAAQEAHPHLKVLLMSGNPVESVHQENPAIRHLPMIGKPFERDHLAESLRGLLDG